MPSPSGADPPAVNLVAAYSFDEGSGAVAGDASANGRTATVVGATWVAGHDGSALSFDGTSAEVDPPALGTFYKTGFTYEAWVQKQSTKIDVGVLGSWDAAQGGAMIWIDHLTGHYRLTLGNSLGNYLDSGQAPIVGQWQHLAATYDGTAARFYIDGVLTGSTTYTGNVGDTNRWRIGAYGASATGFFDGLIDNVRIYNRALTAAEIQTDMSQPVAPDTTPPSAPGTLTATGALGQAALSWGAATDDVAVTRYDVYRSTSAGFTPSTANRIAQPTGTSYTDTGLAAATYYYKVSAEDKAGNIGPPSNEASAIVTADTAPPTVAITAPSAGPVSGPITVAASASDDYGVAGVQFKLDGQNLGAEVTSAPYSVPWDTRGELNGPHTLAAVARDTTGNTATSTVAVTVGNDPGVFTANLRAAYGFDEGTGTIAHDTSANNNTATLAGAGWTTGGRYGGAVTLNGTSAEVDPPALGTFYKTGFTLEAWVNKQTLKKDVAVLGSWADNGGPMIWVDHLAGDYRLTLGTSLSNYLDSGRAPIPGQWQHVAATYDGTTARFYVDGVETASTTYTGNVGDSNSWRIGAYGSSPSGFFDGSIDNVRIYDRALSASEIQVDMASRVQLPDTTPPSVPGTLTATGSIGQAALTWGAATDNVGVVKYNVHRSTTAGFTPTVANRIAQPATTSYTDTSAAPGTYFYKVTAQDAAGNVGGASNEASATVTGDTTPPTVAITSPTGGTVSGQIAVNANASDNQGVVGVQFKLDGVNLGAEDAATPYTVAWDTRGELNGTHRLTAVARDAAGNTRTSAQVTVTLSNAGVSTTGLRAAYALDETSGTTAADSSPNSNHGTVVAGTWSTAGRYGGAVSLNGTSSEVDPPALGTFYKTAFTYEAWVYKQTTKVDVGVVGSWDAAQGGGAMIWIDHLSGRYRLTLGNTFSNYLDSGRTPTIGQWQFVAATYDGSTARIFVDGVETANTPFTGNLGNANAWRIGAYGATPTGFFDGKFDNVRIYDRALSAAEIQTDMASRLQGDQTPPTITAFTPAAGAAGVNVGTSATATFNEPMLASSIKAGTLKLTDASGNTVSATVTYDAANRVAKLTPQTALLYGTTYTVTAKGGPGGVADLSGNTLAASQTWTFTTEASAPPVLVIGSTANAFSTYSTEILRNEGLDVFTTLDVSFLSPAVLAAFDVVLIGDVQLNSNQVTTLTNWVTAGGNLIALSPDKDLASLLGLATASGTLSNAYIKVDTTTPAGAGIVGTTMQFHGSADKYTLNGAAAIATLYSNATTATVNPAVTLRSVGTSGGQAAAFTYDLAKSIVYTRQGNPAWAGQERDGVTGIRPDDMFYSSWLDTSRIAIPQADEQQRLLVNLITLMERDRLPLPHFWYLPRGLKAALVMSGDDHSPGFAPGGTASIFDRFKALSPAGCVVSKWECIRATSYIFPDSVLTNAQAAAYLADGFEIALHPMVGSCPTTVLTPTQLANAFDTQLAQFQAKYTSLPPPATSRTHCVYWPDWASTAKIEAARGIRMDGNYYHYPASWIGSKPGFLNGGGFPMRFADTDGTLIDTYQENTNMDDEAGQVYPATADALLDNALGPNGYYGAFGINIHTDNPAPNPDDEAIVASAQARGVPIISYKQLLDWVDGRNNSTIRGLSMTGGTLTFSTTVAPGANGLQTMLPVQGPSGTLSAITLGGSPVAYSVQTIKGIQYAMFDAATGTYQATYS